MRDTPIKAVVFIVAGIFLCFLGYSLDKRIKQSWMREVIASAPSAVEATREIRSTGRIERVIDGDTLVVDVRLYGTVWLIGERMRLSGIDCPEMPTPEGISAREFVIAWLSKHSASIKPENKRDKFGRMLGDVGSEDGWLSQRLVEAGHAVAYREADGEP